MPKIYSIIWECSLQDKIVAYIFGTIHVKHEQILHVAKQFESYITACDIVACEIDLDNTAQVPLEQYYNNVSTDKLFEFWGPHKYARYAKAMDKYFNMNISAVQHIKPMLLMHEIAVKTLQSNQALETLDEWIWNKASQWGKRKVALEDTINHFELLHTMPFAFQAQMLGKVLKQPNRMKRTHRVLLEKYIQQDIAYLYKYGKRSLGAYKKQMLYDRNAIMVNTILKYIPEGKLFVALGCGHLVGKYGVLRLLKQQGCILKPISRSTN